MTTLGEKIGYPVGRNLIINGAMEVSTRLGYRGFNSTSNTSYGPLDNWKHVYASGNGDDRVWVYQTTDAPPGFNYAYRQRYWEECGCDELYAELAQGIEGSLCKGIKFNQADGYLTLSFWAKKTYHTQSCGVSLRIYGTTTAQYYVPYTLSASNVWEKKVITIPLANSPVVPDTDAYMGNSLRMAVFFHNQGLTGVSTNVWTSTLKDSMGVSTFFYNINMNITGIQLEKGPNATPFEHEDVALTAKKCRRYITYASFDIYTGDGLYTYLFTPDDGTTSSRYLTVLFPEAMRATPTVNGMSLSSYRISRTGATLYQSTTGTRYSSVLHFSAALL